MKNNILIVDDDDISTLLIEKNLKKLDIDIYTTRYGHDAIALCKNINMSCVIMDVRLPILSGIETTKILKEIDPNLLIIIITADAYELTKENAIKSGCDYYFTKPINFPKLIKTINKHLN